MYWERVCMEEDVEKLGKRMAEALRTIDEVKGRLSGAISKYLLRNSSDLDKCTEQAISQAFNRRKTGSRVLISTIECVVHRCQWAGII